MSTPVPLPLCFDYSRPFGNFHDDDDLHCTLSRKSICFHNDRKGSGYEHGVQLTRLQLDATVHVMSFRMEGLVQDYGLNAIAIVLTDSFELRSENLWKAYSQKFAPFEHCVVTLKLDTAKGKVTLLAEDARSTSLGKRKVEDDEPQWCPDDRVALSLCETPSGPNVWAQTFEVPELLLRTPRVGFFMGGFANNKLSIVDPRSTCAIQALADDDKKECYKMYM